MSTGDALEDTPSFSSLPRAATGSQPGGWGLVEALLQQEPIGGHRQWVERLAVTWQGLLPNSPLAVSAFRQLFLLYRGAPQAGASPAGSPGPVRGSQVGLRSWLRTVASGSFSLPRLLGREPQTLRCWQVLRRRGLPPLHSVCPTSL